MMGLKVEVEDSNSENGKPNTFYFIASSPNHFQVTAICTTVQIYNGRIVHVYKYVGNRKGVLQQIQ